MKIGTVLKSKTMKRTILHLKKIHRSVERYLKKDCFGVRLRITDTGGRIHLGHKKGSQGVFLPFFAWENAKEDRQHIWEEEVSELLLTLYLQKTGRSVIMGNHCLLVAEKRRDRKIFRIDAYVMIWD